MSNFVYGLAEDFPTLEELQDAAPSGTKVSKVTTGTSYDLIEVDYQFALTFGDATEFRHNAIETYSAAKEYYYRRLAAMKRVRIKRFIWLGLVAGAFSAAGYFLRML